MESILKDIPGVVVYLDDILITGHTDADHLRSLQETFIAAGESRTKVTEGEVLFYGLFCDIFGLPNR